MTPQARRCLDILQGAHDLPPEEQDALRQLAMALEDEDAAVAIRDLLLVSAPSTILASLEDCAPLHALVHRRLRACDPDTRSVIEAAATFAGTVHGAALLQIRPRTTTSEVAASMDTGLLRGLPRRPGGDWRGQVVPWARAAIDCRAFATAHARWASTAGSMDEVTLALTRSPPQEVALPLSLRRDAHADVEEQVQQLTTALEHPTALDEPAGRRGALELAELERTRGHLDEAERWLAAAEVASAAFGDGENLGGVHLRAARCAMERGAFARVASLLNAAEQALGRPLNASERSPRLMAALEVGDHAGAEAMLGARSLASSTPVDEAATHWLLGVLRLDQGRVAEAEAMFSSAWPVLEDAWPPTPLAIVGVWWTLCAWSYGHHAHARERLERVLPLAKQSVLTHGSALALMASCDAALGRADATRLIAQARFVMPPQTRAATACALLLADAEARLSGPSDAVERVWSACTPELVWQGAAIRVIGRALGCTLPVASPASSWRVHRSGRWFQQGLEPPVSIAHRPVLARLLSTLANPAGQAVAPTALIAAVWPGERILPKAARNRLYVAVATLRSLGLREVLLARADGYLLDGDVVVDDEPSPDID